MCVLYSTVLYYISTSWNFQKCVFCLEKKKIHAVPKRSYDLTIQYRANCLCGLLLTFKKERSFFAEEKICKLKGKSMFQHCTVHTSCTPFARPKAYHVCKTCVWRRIRLQVWRLIRLQVWRLIRLQVWRLIRLQVWRNLELLAQSGYRLWRVSITHDWKKLPTHHCFANRLLLLSCCRAFFSLLRP